MLQLQSPKSVLIKGATGSNASRINGVYKLTNLPLYNGRPLWQKEGDTDEWLRCIRSTKWKISTSEDIEADNSSGRFLSVEKGLADPTAGKQWQAYDYTSKKWETQSQASVAAVSDQNGYPCYCYNNASLLLCFSVEISATLT